MKKRGFHDGEERDLITAYQSGEFRPVKDQQKVKQTAVHAARRYLQKNARVTISRDLEMLKRRPAEEGLPYQTLLASRAPQIRQRQRPSGEQSGVSLSRHRRKRRLPSCIDQSRSPLTRSSRPAAVRVRQLMLCKIR
jgi:predicted DNA binding CopG/RHH family protein